MRMFTVLMVIVIICFANISCENMNDKLPEIDPKGVVSQPLDCDDEDGNNYVNEPTEDELAMEERFQAQFKWSLDELQEYVEERLNNMSTPEYRRSINRVESYSLTFERGFVTYKGEPQASEIMFYVFITENPSTEITELYPDRLYGFMVFVGDNRLGRMIADAAIGNWDSTESSFLNWVKGNITLSAQKAMDNFNQGVCRNLVYKTNFPDGKCLYDCCHPCLMKVPHLFRFPNQCSGTVDKRCSVAVDYWASFGVDFSEI